MRVLRTAGETSALPPCVLVPTMGFLHAGHAELIRLGVGHASDLPGGCVVSIFVNPSQFNDPRDYASYPRDLDRDLASCERAGAAAVFVPDEHEVYPPSSPPRWPAVPSVGHLPRLEEVGRPGHFEGVCRVLARLFEMVPCVRAVFGEKDYQQLRLAHALVTQENLAVEIVSAPTVREDDGLAMSSRNVRLSPEGRTRARAISLALRRAQGARTPAHAERIMLDTLWEAGISRIEYATIRRQDDLMPLDERDAETVPARALITAYVDGTRLLDNAPWRPHLAQP